MMTSRNRERVLRDICLNHSTRSDKGRACPTKLNKQELEDAYYAVVDENLRLKNQILPLEQKLKVLMAKLQRMTNAQRSTIMKEKSTCYGSQALVHEQKEIIEDLELANQKLVEKIKLLNMQMCSTKQFISSRQGTRCTNCFLRNSNSMLNSTKRSENNLKASNSCQYLDKEVMTTRSFMTSVSVNTEQQEQKLKLNLSCEENKCADQIDNLKRKITELEQALVEASGKHTNAMSQLDHQGISLRRENISLRSVNSSLEEKLQELSNKQRATQILYNELSSELVLEKRKVTELETELKLNSGTSVNIAKTIEDHIVKMKIEESLKKHDEVKKQVQRVSVRSDVGSKHSDDSGYIDNSRTGHSDVFEKQNHELLRRIDDLQSQINGIQKSKALISQMSSPKRANGILTNIETSKVDAVHTEETLKQNGQSSSPKQTNAELIAHSSTDSDTKHDTIKQADNTQFSAFFVNIENTSSPKRSRTTQGPVNNNCNDKTTTDLSISLKTNAKVKKSDKKNDSRRVIVKNNSFKESIISDSEKRDRTRTLSKSSQDKPRANELNKKAKSVEDEINRKNDENLNNKATSEVNVKKMECRDSIDSAKTYIVSGDGRGSPDNTDCEMSSYSDLPSERDDNLPVSVLSPGEDRARVYSSDTARTEFASLSEGELPGFHTARQLSMGEKPMSGVVGRDYNDNMSSTQSAKAALAAVAAELARCKQLLRLSSANV